MSSDDLVPDVPPELASTVSTLRRQLDRVPATATADLDDVVRRGRRHVRRRQLVSCGIGLAVVVTGTTFALGTNPVPSGTAGPPAGPVPEATVELGSQHVTEIYEAADEALAEAGMEVETIRWDVSDRPLYGPIPYQISGAFDQELIDVPGFPEAFPAEFANAMVQLKDNSMEVEVARVDGGLPLERDYCAWFDVMAPDDADLATWCDQRRRDDGSLLVTMPEAQTVVSIWSGGQVTARQSSIGEVGPGEPVLNDAPPIGLDVLTKVATSPDLRWRY